MFLAVCAYAYEWNIFLHGVGHDSAYPSGKKGSKSVHLFYYKDHYSPLVPLKKTHMSKRTKTAPVASDSSSNESSDEKPKPKKKSSNKKEEDEEDTVVKSRRRSARERKPKRY